MNIPPYESNPSTSTNSIVAYDHKVCRICLMNGPAQRSIFDYLDEERTNVNQMILCICSVQMEPDDPFSNNICSRCLQDLRVGYAFRKRCEASEAMLRNQKIEVDLEVPKTEDVKQEPVEYYERCENRSAETMMDQENRTNMALPNVDELSRRNNSYVFHSTTFHNYSPDNESPDETTTDVLENSYACDECDFSTAKRQNFVRHTKMHRRVKLRGVKYTCNTCDSFFYSESKLRNHNKAVHDIEEIFSCDRCGYSSRRLGDVKKHMMRHALDKTYKCDQCSTSFKTPQDLTQHKLKHIVDKKFICELCHTTFKTINQLHIHMKAHSKNISYSCTVCNAVFLRKHQLRAHMIKHGDDRKYPCVVCSSAFKRKAHLVDHLKLHTDAKVFACDMCKYTSKTKYLMKSHMDKHATEKRFTCEKCGKTFKRRCELLTHGKRCKMMKLSKEQQDI